jgi:cytochrome c2
MKCCKANSLAHLLFGAPRRFILSLTSCLNAQDFETWQMQFLSSFRVFDTTDAGAPKRQDPNSHSIYSCKVGSLVNFKYSNTLKKGDCVSTEAAPDPWIENVQAAHDGTLINHRQPNPEKRQLVINSLKSLSLSN